MLYSTRNILRLCGRCNFQNKRLAQTRVSNGVNTEIIEKKRRGNKDFTLLLQQHKDKITFSSYLESEKLDLGYYRYHLKTIKRAKKTQLTEYKDKSLPPLPVSLQYYVDAERLLKEESVENVPEPEKDFQLPFGKVAPITYKTETPGPQKTESNPNIVKTDEFDRSNIDKWMSNYEHYDDTKLSEENIETYDEEALDSEWGKFYGTPDPSVGVSRIPCGGCGALMHCSDPSIPGYLPSEIFKEREDDELKKMECQRCHFLKEYNIALDVTVQPEEYEKLLQSIRSVGQLMKLEKPHSFVIIEIANEYSSRLMVVRRFLYYGKKINVP